MKPMPFEYYRAESLEDAITALDRADGAGRLLSGGQSLVPMLNLRLMPATVIIDIKRIAELHEVQERRDAISYGACITHAQFEDGQVADACNGLLRFVAAGISYRAVRTRGTLGGALALADASTDWVTGMITAGATLELYGATGTRRLPVADFVLGPYQTAIDPDSEILTTVEVPRSLPGSCWGYYKIMHKPGEYASSLAGVLIDRERGVARTVLGGANRPPVQLATTGNLLRKAPSWSSALEEELSNSIRTDLFENDRVGDPWELRSWTTCVIRAARHALTHHHTNSGRTL